LVERCAAALLYDKTAGASLLPGWKVILFQKSVDIARTERIPFAEPEARMLSVEGPPAEGGMTRFVISSEGALDDYEPKRD
jgi:hypothetical protein